MDTIQIVNLSTGYKQGKSNSRVVMQHLNATFRSGELSCLIGSNGVGKSTLLRTLSAFQPALDGEVYIESRTLDNYTAAELSKEVSVVLTGKPDVRNMSIEEMIGLGRSPYTGFFGRLSDNDKSIVDESITLVGIQHLKGRMIHSLSDGERQKVMIAKALAQQTPIILLDEPTAFLDFPSKVEMLKLLHRLAHEMDKTILLSTHDLELAVRLADNLWKMDAEGLHLVEKAEVEKEIQEAIEG